LVEKYALVIWEAADIFKFVLNNTFVDCERVLIIIGAPRSVPPVSEQLVMMTTEYLIHLVFFIDVFY